MSLVVGRMLKEQLEPYPIVKNGVPKKTLSTVENTKISVMFKYQVT